MSSCIIGAIMYCTAAITIPGPVQSQHSYLNNDAWRYAAYYGPAIQRPFVVLPGTFPVTRRG